MIGYQREPQLIAELENMVVRQSLVFLAIASSNDLSIDHFAVFLVCDISANKCTRDTHYGLC